MPSRKKKDEPRSLTTDELNQWYTASDAAKKLSETSGRPVPVSYVNKLRALDKVRTLKLHDRLVLYSKADIDDYRVESRGTKSGQAKRVGKTGPTVREARRMAKATEENAEPSVA